MRQKRREGFTLETVTSPMSLAGGKNSPCHQTPEEKSMVPLHRPPSKETFPVYLFRQLRAPISLLTTVSVDVPFVPFLLTSNHLSNRAPRGFHVIDHINSRFLPTLSFQHLEESSRTYMITGWIIAVYLAREESTTRLGSHLPRRKTTHTGRTSSALMT